MNHMQNTLNNTSGKRDEQHCTKRLAAESERISSTYIEPSNTMDSNEISRWNSESFEHSPLKNFQHHRYISYVSKSLYNKQSRASNFPKISKSKRAISHNFQLKKIPRNIQSSEIDSVHLHRIFHPQPKRNIMNTTLTRIQMIHKNKESVRPTQIFRMTSLYKQNFFKANPASDGIKVNSIELKQKWQSRKVNLKAMHLF